MRRSIAHMALVLLLVEAIPARAIDKGYSEALRLMGGDIRSADSGDAVQVIALLGAVLLALVLAARYYTRKQAADTKPARTQRWTKRGSLTFAQRAAGLGLKAHEIRNLWKVSTKLSPKMPQTLLATTTGMQYLKRNLATRIRKREKEAEMLKSILGKLERSEQGSFLDRETVRVSVDMQIWLVKKARPRNGEAGPRPEAGEEFELGDVQQNQGRLLDLSEGGAAIRVDMALEEGDVVEFGSADSQIWLPPISADVVHTVAVDEADSAEDADADADTDTDAEAQLLLVHVRFINPPLTEIRKALHDIQADAQLDEESEEADEVGTQ